MLQTLLLVASVCTLNLNYELPLTGTINMLPEFQHQYRPSRENHGCQSTVAFLHQTQNQGFELSDTIPGKRDGAILKFEELDTAVHTLPIAA